MKSCLNQKCKKKFEPGRNTRGMYCSRSCSATVNNHKHPKRVRESSIKDCLMCDRTLKYQAKFCSKSCSGAFKRAALIKNWLAGTYSGSDASGVLSAAVRNYLISEANNACTICGWSVKNPSIDKVILTVDHTDGDWTNNRPGNLTVLCYNCHTLTPTFGALNSNGLFSTRLGSYRYRGAVDE